MHLKDEAQMREIIEEVNYNDKKRDNSLDGLTQEERLEISLFHSLK
jgi:hypothetical protein